MPGIDDALLVELFARLGVGAPYDWQRRAFARMVAGEPPRQIKVPTAAGKTMLVAIFVAALATRARAGLPATQRRLAFAVNRRVLVDEATRLCVRIRELLDAGELPALRDALASLSVTGKPLAISTLRGQFADNGEWSLDPSTPAIVLATPDMLGSRLLFRGYGLGRSRAATHAGLLGIDTLVVHDEAHLAPAFSHLLRQIEARAAADAAAIGRPLIHVIEMTATLRPGVGGEPLVCDIASDAALVARMSARKRLGFKTIAAEGRKAGGAIAAAIVDAAVAHRDANRAVAIFVASPDQAATIARDLGRKGIDPARIVQLTGTMRGHERTALLDSPAYLRFVSDERRGNDGSAFFIATSAGEIGLDIDADIGLFDLATLDRLIQRAGRINRRGQGAGAITLIHANGEEAPEAVRPRCLAAIDLLQTLAAYADGIDASPLALSALLDQPGYADACDPAPAMRALEPQVIDMFAMTSLSLGQLRCPAPATYIQGLVDEEADITLAWRQLPAAHADVGRWLDAWPLVTAELARLPRERARKFIVDRLLKAPAGVAPLALLLDAQGQLAEGGVLMPGAHVWRWLDRLPAGGTVLFASAAGGLSVQGQPDADATAEVPDVSGQCTDAHGLERGVVQAITVKLAIEDEQPVWSCADRHDATLPGLLAACCEGWQIVFHDCPIAPAAPCELSVRVWQARPGVHAPDAGDLAALAPRPRLLGEHLQLAARAGHALAAALSLPADFAAANPRAAVTHDAGKDESRWQRAIGNADLAQPLAKSGGARFDNAINDGYRHELGSLLRPTADGLTRLEQHLVVSHHGWARPVFLGNARDKPGCAALADRAARDYAALGASLGPWALAHLEALLKAADVLAEVEAERFAAQPAWAMPPAPAEVVIPTVAPQAFSLPVDAANFGEYLACLGLFALALHAGRVVEASWSGGGFHLHGIDADGVLALLASLRGATVAPDTEATRPEMADAAYPPLLLRLAGLPPLPLNPWLGEGLDEGSGWKLGAGQTRAPVILDSLVASCAASLDLPDFTPADLPTLGGARVGADASKFRFDSATNWSAQDAGFSLNEHARFKSSRPWVELLSAIGLQHFFPPPADASHRYWLWPEPLPRPLAIAAARGLLPGAGPAYEAALVPSGKMKDVFPAQPVPQRNPTCPPHLLMI
ncbi:MULTISPECIES: type I-G CRISPR-associated helicase/endonuclease Cas3g [Derxia]|uniref:Type I-G CRISPR-associated helicase/endonuclease Cas3g n=1 Tax=Derxia gummosa DSM 723 TaxID=1121388 RepID=A0A8B6X794_9BURK|nr:MULTISPECIES: type I-U CRISPR-associated helicase/endonuclease Cas3 [Derxia]